MGDEQRHRQELQIHDNACKGLWADLNANYAVITHNLVYNNWDEGIFIEISSGAKSYATPCTGTKGRRGIGGAGWDGGITLASSDHAEIAHNTVTGNCNGITGTQQNRRRHARLLENITVRQRSLRAPVSGGVAADNGADLTKRNIVFTNNTFGAGMQHCYLRC